MTRRRRHRRVPGLRRRVRPAIQPLEPRRLLSGLPAYPLLPLAGQPAGDAPRASVNGEAFEVAAAPLYRSDGSTAGSVVRHRRHLRRHAPPVHGQPDWPRRQRPGLSSSTPGPGSVTSVWRTDGTVRLTNVLGGVGEQATFAKHGDYVYFGAGRDDTGWELWRTNGTPEGTALFKDINQNP